MSVVWVLETPESKFSIAHALIGDHAVRTIASVRSFLHLLKMEKKFLPTLIIVDLDNCENSIAKLERVFSTHLSECKRLYVSKKDESRNRSANIYFLKRTYCEVESLQLTKLVRKIILTCDNPDMKVSHSELKFKDLVFDTENFLIDLPGSGPQKITMKEAKILALLIKKKGTCLTRDEIKEKVWRDVNVSSRTVDCHISRLRKRLGDASVEIDSIYRGGYVLR